MDNLLQLKNEVAQANSNVKIGRIKGIGLARMIEIKDKEGNFNSQLTKKLQHELLIEGGVFVRTPSNPNEVNTLFIKMPLVVTKAEMNEGFRRIKEVLVNFNLNE